MSEFYRFRSIDTLLGKHQELEKQTIYFASPEELNDPMEAFRNVFWNGDKIVWTNLLKHYVFCLNRSFGILRVAGESIEFANDSTPFPAYWDRPPLPQEQDFLSITWGRISNLPNMKDVIKALSKSKRKIRYGEIGFYLQGIHCIIFNDILNLHVELGIISETEAFHPLDEEVVAASIESILNLIETTKTVEYEEQLEADFYVFEHFYHNMLFTCTYNNHQLYTSILGKNYLLLKFDFPKVYLKNLIDLPFPKWWTACFTESYESLSAWANYADAHKGVCLIFDKEIIWNIKKYRMTEFRKVNYENTPTEIDFFRSLGAGTVAEIKKTWYTDEDGTISECAAHIGNESEENNWREEYWNKFFHYITTKNRDWKYEKEHRIILYDIVKGFVNKDERTLTYDFNSLKGIIYGMRTSFETKMKVFEIIEEKCKEYKRTDFKFFQAFYSEEQGQIQTHPIVSPFSDTNDNAQSI